MMGPAAASCEVQVPGHTFGAVVYEGAPAGTAMSCVPRVSTPMSYFLSVGL